MSIIPLMIDMKDKKVVVVGGGKVAERRVSSLLDMKCNIFVISPAITDRLQSYHNKKLIQWKEKYFSKSDLDEAFLTIAATNDTAVNKEVSISIPPNSLINTVDSAEQGNVQFPIQVKRGKLSIAVSTNGASPTLAKKIQQELAKQYDTQYEGYVDFLYKARVQVKKSNLPPKERQQILKELVSNSEYKHPLKQMEWLNKNK
ncbi:NAD(P)-binding protein [Aquibacillus kalidii]|uniref:NAD(P)-binding protein n=1 Tax=Aquibacillus kalidii TaxID=2762597 RepID=UPI0016442AC5|nr:NAD(P)-binding protein [Aquibacillus kalidii]